MSDDDDPIPFFPLMTVISGGKVRTVLRPGVTQEQYEKHRAAFETRRQAGIKAERDAVIDAEIEEEREKRDAGAARRRKLIAGEEPDEDDV